MSGRRIIGSDGREWVPADESPPPPPSSGNEPIPVDEPSRGFKVFEGDGEQAVRTLIDMLLPEWGFRSRTLNALDPDPNKRLAITNATLPLWYFDGLKVQESKTICRLDRERGWIPFFDYWNGPFNFTWLCQPGIGWMDTNAKDTDPYDPTHELKYQSLDWTNQIRRVIPNPALPYRYVQVETFSYFNPPRYDPSLDRWFVGDRAVGLFDSPELMTVQTLVGHTGSGDSAVSYGPVGDKGQPGGHGRVVTPVIMRYPGIHFRDRLYFYQQPPFMARVYSESLMVDGIPVPLSGGRDLRIDAMCFGPFKVWGRSGVDWFLLEETLMRGSIDDWSAGGTWRDYRRYTDYGGNPPPTELPPDLGWFRTKAGAQWCRDVVPLS